MISFSWHLKGEKNTVKYSNKALVLPCDQKCEHSTITRITGVGQVGLKSRTEEVK